MRVRVALLEIVAFRSDFASGGRPCDSDFIFVTFFLVPMLRVQAHVWRGAPVTCLEVTTHSRCSLYSAARLKVDNC
jgi:hypothetical protein